MPGNPKRPIISLTSGVIIPRSSAIIGRYEKRLNSVLRKSSTGTSTHLPFIAVSSPARTSQ